MNSCSQWAPGSKNFSGGTLWGTAAISRGGGLEKDKKLGFAFLPFLFIFFILFLLPFFRPSTPRRNDTHNKKYYKPIKTEKKLLQLNRWLLFSPVTAVAFLPSLAYCYTAYGDNTTRKSMPFLPVPVPFSYPWATNFALILSVISYFSSFLPSFIVLHSSLLLPRLSLFYTCTPKPRARMFTQR